MRSFTVAPSRHIRGNCFEVKAQPLSLHPPIHSHPTLQRYLIYADDNRPSDNIEINKQLLQTRKDAKLIGELCSGNDPISYNFL